MQAKLETKIQAMIDRRPPKSDGDSSNQSSEQKQQQSRTPKKKSSSMEEIEVPKLSLETVRDWRGIDEDLSDLQ